MVDPPRATSPPANTSVMLVSPPASMAILPSLVISMGVARCTVGLGPCPTAATTVSTGIQNSEPGIGTGTGRPDASGGTSCIQMHCRSEEHTSELQSRLHLVCRLLLEKKKTTH